MTRFENYASFVLTEPSFTGWTAIVSFLKKIGQIKDRCMGPPVFNARFKLFQLLWKEKTSVFDAVNYQHENLEQKIHLNDCNAFFDVFWTSWGNPPKTLKKRQKTDYNHSDGFFTPNFHGDSWPHQKRSFFLFTKVEKIQTAP